MKNTTLIHMEKDGKYLMMHRIKKENDINKDKWIGVGGKIKENESPYVCALRETYEETGLTVKDLTYRGVVTFVSDECEGEYMHLFTAKDFEGELHTSDEGVLEWVKISDLYGKNIWEGDKIFLRLLETDEPFFDLRLEYRQDKLSSACLNGKVILGKEKLAVSACLLGIPCRYDGQSKPCDKIALLEDFFEFLPVCPECEGGLPTPREPAEIKGDRVVSRSGKDVTSNYKKGAEYATALSYAHRCKYALLKKNSPSCSSNKIYDGTFTGNLIFGKGICAREMEKANIKVFDEDSIDKLVEEIKTQKA